MSKLITKDQQEVYCLAWKQSNLPKAVFCKQNNISISALYMWLKKFNTSSSNVAATTTNVNNSQASDAIKFLQINNHNSINLDKYSYTQHHAIEVIIPNGIKINITLHPNNFNTLIQELLQWK